MKDEAEEMQVPAPSKSKNGKGASGKIIPAAVFGGLGYSD